MTEMKVHGRHLRNVTPARSVAQFLGWASVFAILSGCAVNPFTDAKVDPASPVAGEVAKMAKTGGHDYPSFNEIPAVPNDVRPIRQYGVQAAKMEQARDDLVRATAPGTWTLQNTEAFASTARKAAGPEIAPAERTDTEAFANELRQRATPPPPPVR